jgi:hypothetical protein
MFWKAGRDGRGYMNGSDSCDVIEVLARSFSRLTHRSEPALEKAATPFQSGQTDGSQARLRSLNLTPRSVPDPSFQTRPRETPGQDDTNLFSNHVQPGQDRVDLEARTARFRAFEPTHRRFLVTRATKKELQRGGRELEKHCAERSIWNVLEIRNCSTRESVNGSNS